MYSFDASAIVDLWDNYPIQNPHFAPMWDWFKTQVEQKVFCISDIALKEVKDKIIYKSEYGSLEKDIPKSKLFIQALNTITLNKITADDLISVQHIKTLLDIQEDNYSTKGVGENDLLIIANAKNNGTILVTNENRQNNLPNIKAKYKMPAVCNLNEVNLKNKNLAELLHISDLWQ